MSRCVQCVAINATGHSYVSVVVVGFNESMLVQGVCVLSSTMMLCLNVNVLYCYSDALHSLKSSEIASDHQTAIGLW